MAILTIGFNPAIDRILECPEFHVGGHQQARQIARLAAGKAANVNRTLAALGTDSIASGFVGADALEFFHEQLLSAGPGRILCRFVEVLGATRENISILDPQRRLETHLRDRGFAVSAEECGLLKQKVLHELKPGDVVIFAGSLCPGVDQAFYRELLQECLSHGARVVVDTSGDPLRTAVRLPEQFPPLWLIKPNLEELAHASEGWETGDGGGGQAGVDGGMRGGIGGRAVLNEVGAIVAAATPLLKQVEEVLVSRGRSGAMLFTRHGGVLSAHLKEGETAPPAIRTVGCGDYLLAIYVSEVLAGREVEHALSRAVAGASARAMSERMDEIDANLLRQVLGEVVVERV